jgi:hypothetical protein
MFNLHLQDLRKLKTSDLLSEKQTLSVLGGQCNLDSTFNSEQDITFSAGNSDIDTSGNIIDSNNNNISNVDTNGNDFRADPGTIDIQ